MHPKYNSVMVAEELGLPVVKVQHHYAHILSCMAENDCADQVVGVSFDGTGYGTDGTIWGGEILLADLNGFERTGSVMPFLQIGGDASSKEGWRIAVSLLYGMTGDREKAWTIFGEGKEIIEKSEIPVNEGRAPEDYYLFANDECLDINEGITYGSSNSKYYSSIGARNSNNQVVFEESDVSFKSGEECITELQKIIDELGYHSEDFIFACYPLNSQTMKNLEEQYLQEGRLTEEKRKESWSQEDDAYFIYGYQKYEDIPIFHEMMSIARSMAYDTPDNAPVQAIYSTRGIEILDIGGVYEFEKGEQQVLLKPFEDIAAVVEEKFENILNDAEYEVTRAKFYERVYLDEGQKYKADPIWYFEVVENNISKSVTLINAETGKEIFLQ